MSTARFSQTARARPSRCAGVDPLRNQPGASKWNRCEIRDARVRSSGGSAASTLSRAAATTVPSPSSAAGPGRPDRNSESASSVVRPVSRVR